MFGYIKGMVFVCIMFSYEVASNLCIDDDDHEWMMMMTIMIFRVDKFYRSS